MAALNAAIDGVLAPMGRSTLDHRGQQTTPIGGEAALAQIIGQP
jgi:hypothetical protein